MGNVKKLPFSDGYFIGYWSCGVIEHFYEGYESIATEMSRVINENGYLFLVFPYMSILRRIKASLGYYPIWRSESPLNFYQFALNANTVIESFKKNSFRLIKSIPIEGIKGLKTEISSLNSVFQRIYSYKGNNLIIKIFRIGMDMAMAPITGHGILLIFKNPPCQILINHIL